MCIYSTSAPKKCPEFNKITMKNRKQESHPLFPVYMILKTTVSPEEKQCMLSFQVQLSSLPDRVYTEPVYVHNYVQDI